MSEVSPHVEPDTELSRACEEAWTLAQRASRGAPDGARVSVAVELAHAEVADMLRETSLGELFTWDARAKGDPVALSSRGVAASLSNGPGVDGEIAALLASIHDATPSGVDAPPPRVLCALPFDAADTRPSAWGALARGVISLPRWTLSDDGATRALRLVASPAELARPMLRATHAGRPRSARVVGRRDFDDDYVERVERALGALSGDVTKLVAAREIELALDRPMSVEHAIASLAKTKGLTRFAVERHGAAFVGATPERLVRRTGTVIESEAVAGTRRAADEAWLSASGKDRREHEIVRDAIVGALVSMGADVARCGAARERAAGNVVHLTTEITATMTAPPTALGLARALSPTPAVSGFPRRTALAWLRENEPPRGLYAGPVGWVDGRGDGHFVVGIRSALLTNGRAHAYVGAGIVEGSVPKAELEETRWKAETLLGLMGLSG